MTISIRLAGKQVRKNARFFILGSEKDWSTLGLDDKEKNYLKKNLKDSRKLIAVPHLEEVLYIQMLPTGPVTPRVLEDFRNNGHSFALAANFMKLNAAAVNDLTAHPELALAVAEGAALGSYQFLTFRKERQKEKNPLNSIDVYSKGLTKDQVNRLEVTVDAVYRARDLVNTPQSHLNAIQLSLELEMMAMDAGIKVEVLNEAKIEALKMGGLLAVNKGSNIPPTFTIMEWKPQKPVNKKPIVLVGKGVVYDTGGLTLKPTPNSMDQMKSDMAGAAVVGAAMYAIGKLELPVHVVALIPATDNRPGEDAYTPGDVIHMHNGMTVEVLNTDAEGRMILADALSYAQRFKPELVMDFATLTGAAASAIGHYGTVMMGTAGERVKQDIKTSGERVYERLVEFPFWDEYKDLIKSDVADIKNIGGPVGGAITAGKFLEYFVAYPWLHFDIAGPSFIKSNDGYRGKNGTGVGVRFLIDYFTQLQQHEQKRNSKGRN